MSLLVDSTMGSLHPPVKRKVVGSSPTRPANMQGFHTHTDAKGYGDLIKMATTSIHPAPSLGQKQVILDNLITKTCGMKT